MSHILSIDEFEKTLSDVTFGVSCSDSDDETHESNAGRLLLAYKAALEEKSLRELERKNRTLRAQRSHGSSA